MDWSQVPPYLLAIAGVAGGAVSLLKWKSDSTDQEDRRRNEAVAQTIEAYKETIAQLDKRVDQAEQTARQATDRALVADQRINDLQIAHAACERRNVELTAMLELMRTVLRDRGINVPAFGTQPIDTPSYEQRPPA